MPDPQPPAFYDPGAIAGQLSIWDELVHRARSMPERNDRLEAGMLSHIGLLDDQAIIRIGCVARRESERATKSRHPRTRKAWDNLLVVCISEWLRRHPRPVQSLA